MKPRMALETRDVQAALAASQAEAERNGWPNVSIAVVDDGAHLLGFIRLGDSTPLNARISLEKARTAARSRRESGYFEESIKSGRNAYLSVPDATFLEGAVPVIVGGTCIGAIGVSGVRSDQDAQIARAGVNAILEGAGQATNRS
jgi:glc operon protein GlcG